MKKYEVTIDSEGTVRWYVKNKLHREDGPAVEYADGYKAWYKNDLLHRENGPAVEYADWGKEWWKNGRLYREDGPAIEYANGAKVWYIKGKKFSKAQSKMRRQVVERWVVEALAKSIDRAFSDLDKQSTPIARLGPARL